MYWWPYKKSCERHVSLVESVTSHAYKVFSVSLHCTSSRFHRHGVILCTLHAECGAISLIVCRWNQPVWVSQEAAVSSSTAGRRGDKNILRHHKKKMQTNMFAIMWLDKYFDSCRCFCVSRFVFTLVLVHLYYFQNQFNVGPLSLVKGTWNDPAHHPLLSTHPYILDIMH